MGARETHTGSYCACFCIPGLSDVAPLLMMTTLLPLVSSNEKTKRRCVCAHMCALMHAKVPAHLMSMSRESKSLKVLAVGLWMVAHTVMPDCATFFTTLITS